MMLIRGTSRRAWAEFIPVSAELDRQILTALERAEPRGLICQAIEDKTGRIHQAVSGNLRHLVERGFVIPTDARGVTRSNRQAIVWRLAPPELWGVRPEKPTLTDEIEELWEIAEECRAWSRAVINHADEKGMPQHSAQELTRSGFDRIAGKLDAVTNRLAEKLLS